MAIPISVLDFDSTFTFARTLGPYVESLGYRRYWFAEHLPQPSAEIFITLLSGLTDTLRVGAGGILLRVRNVRQSATNFQYLVGAFGDRIDAGFCAGLAPPSELEAFTEAERASMSLDAFDARVRRWVAQLRSGLDDGVPEIWSLGSGMASARRAADLGLSYAYSLFHSGSIDDPAAMSTYYETFRPSSPADAPRAILAFAGLCAPTDDEAAMRIAQHSPEFVRPVIWGSPSTCSARLAELVARYRPDEVMLLELSQSLEEKHESYRLWAEVVTAHAPRGG